MEMKSSKYKHPDFAPKSISKITFIILSHLQNTNSSTLNEFKEHKEVQKLADSYILSKTLSNMHQQGYLMKQNGGAYRRNPNFTLDKRGKIVIESVNTGMTSVVEGKIKPKSKTLASKSKSTAKKKKSKSLQKPPSSDLQISKQEQTAELDPEQIQLEMYLSEDARAFVNNAQIMIQENSAYRKALIDIHGLIGRLLNLK